MDAETERYLTEMDQERITKEQDEEIMKIKQRQVTVREKSNGPPLGNFCKKKNRGDKLKILFN